jgi:GDP-4-dehydro-6-deoxy-D-mannose reductase
MDRKGLDLVICRPFTHIGPRQSRQFAASNFSWQISQIEKGKQPPYIQVGNLSSKRDIIDVSDMVRAYRMSALLSGAPGPFNLCSKKVISMKDMLDLLISMSSVPIEVQIDPNRFRSVDIPIYLGDPERFQAITGWKAKIPLETTLQQLLDYWRLIAK